MAPQVRDPCQTQNQTLSSLAALDTSSLRGTSGGRIDLATTRPTAGSTNRTLESITDRPLPSRVGKALKDRLFKCEICCKRFVQKQTLKQHILTHTGQRPFPCSMCDKAFTQRGALNRHAALHAEETEVFSCHVCDQIFRQRSNPTRHMNTHASNDASRFKCEICLRQFGRKDGLKRHAKRHLSKREMFFCGVCEESFPSSASLVRHEQNHRKNGEQRGTCRVCRGVFVRKLGTMKRTAPSSHVFAPSQSDEADTKAHVENICPSCKSKPNGRRVKVHICSICRMEFRSKEKLSTHAELAHLDNVSFVSCEVCGESFVGRSHFEKHCLVHWDQIDLIPDLDIYQCNYCDMLFSNRTQIIAHVRYHERKRQINIEEKEKAARNKQMRADTPASEMGSQSLNEDLKNEDKDPIVNTVEESANDDSSTKEIIKREKDTVDVVEEDEEEMKFSFYSEETKSESQVDAGEDSDLMRNNETIQNPFNKPPPFNDASNITLKFENEEIRLIKVTPIEHYAQKNNVGTLGDYGIDHLTTKTVKFEDFEEKIHVEDTANDAEPGSIETIHDLNISYNNNDTSDQSIVRSEIDETSEFGSECIYSETITEDLDDVNSVKSVDTFTEDGKHSVKSMNTFTEGREHSVTSLSVLTAISNLPKEISLANLPKEIRDIVLDFDGSCQVGDVSRDENCTRSNQMSASSLVYSTTKSKQSILSNELVDAMISDLTKTFVSPHVKIKNSAIKTGIDLHLLKDINEKSENSPINFVYEDNKPIGIVYENDEMIEVIQHVEDSTLKEEVKTENARTNGDTKELELGVDIVHKAESVMSEDAIVEMNDGDHKGDIEMHYEIMVDDKPEGLQQSQAKDHVQSEADNVDHTGLHPSDEETGADEQDSEQSFVLLETPDKDLMFLLDERTTSAPNSPRDIDDDFEHFDEKTDDKTHEASTREADVDETMYESIGNVKLKRAPRNVKRQGESSDGSEVPDEMMFHLSKVKFKRPPAPKRRRLRNDLSGEKNSLVRKPVTKPSRKSAQIDNIRDQIVEEEYVYLEGPNETNEQSFFCYVCKKSYTSRNSLKRHFRTTHTSVEPVACSACDKKFQTKDALRKHMRTLHAPHQFKCDACSKTFNRKDALASHARLHASDKPFTCAVCDARFAQKQSLYAHALRHGERSHRCLYCDKGFFTKQLRDTHHLTHTDVRKYQCEVCKRSFKQLNHLQTHFLVHGTRSKKTFQCNDCGGKFAHKGSLKRHAAIHLADGRKKFYCLHCGKGVNHRITLERHLKNKVCGGKIKARGKTKGS